MSLIGKVFNFQPFLKKSSKSNERLFSNDSPALPLGHAPSPPSQCWTCLCSLSIPRIKSKYKILWNQLFHMVYSFFWNFKWADRDMDRHKLGHWKQALCFFSRSLKTKAVFISRSLKTKAMLIWLLSIWIQFKLVILKIIYIIFFPLKKYLLEI